MGRTTLVMGGSGFLGSTVIRQLAGRGDRVRVWLRPSSSDAALDGLDVEVVRGELDDPAALRAAMSGADAVHYCIVDARAWLRDPSPLFRTNVELLGHVIEAAVEVGVPRFVFCSSVVAIGIPAEGTAGVADELTPHTWRHLGGPYVESRLQAEEAVLRACRERGLPAVVLNVSTTYGRGDRGPTPHGKLLRAAAEGRMPAYVSGVCMDVVGIEDAAAAFLLAEERGTVGERYIVSERYLPIQELFVIAADEAGVKPPRIGLPIPAIRVLGALGSAWSRLARRDTVVTRTSVRLMTLQSAIDHGKATRELGWEPRPIEESVREAVRWFSAQPRS